MASERNKRDTLFPGSAPGKSSFGSRNVMKQPHAQKLDVLPSNTTKPSKAYSKSETKEKFAPQAPASGRFAKRLAQNDVTEFRKTPSRVTYHKFMVFDQAGSANVACDNTRERNLVAIKRFNGIRKSSMRKIQPFTSDYVVSIKETYFENDDMIVVYERMDVSLRHVTGIMQGPFNPYQIAAVCKQVNPATICVANQGLLIKTR